MVARHTSMGNVAVAVIDASTGSVQHVPASPKVGAAILFSLGSSSERFPPSPLSLPLLLFNHGWFCLKANENRSKSKTISKT